MPLAKRAGLAVLLAVAVLLAGAKSQSYGTTKWKFILDYCIKYYGAVKPQVWLTGAHYNT